jgi:tRNA (guanosine-2'-O-)-methyltransferase
MRYCITDERLARIRQVLARRQKGLTLVIDNVHDPHNVSAILRSCDAFGVPGVHLYYTTSAFPVLGQKSSASARKWVTRTRHSDPNAMCDGLKSQDFQILATGFSARAKPLTNWDLSRPTAVILGNEHNGASPELAQMADGEIYIPMMGMVQSLNVSVAAAIILYEAWRQRWAKGMYDKASLSPEELALLEKDWASR